MAASHGTALDTSASYSGVLISNLGLQIGYSKAFLRFSHSLWAYNSKYITMYLFHVSSNSLFTNHPVYYSTIYYKLESVVK